MPVKVIFSVYSFLMEATALALVGRKMKAAQLAYGDEVGGAKLSDLQINHNPLGSLATPSAVILPGQKGVTWNDRMIPKSVIVQKSKRKEIVLEVDTRDRLFKTTSSRLIVR